jgi:predicted NodU family carbamoyl transferase
MLRRLLTVEGERLSRRLYPLPVSAQDDVYDALRSAPVPVAAASILRNLDDAVMGLLTHHAMRAKCNRVVLAGGIFENSRLCGEIVDSEIVSYLRVPSMPGWSLLPFGAGATEAGLTPREQGPYLGLRWPQATLGDGAVAVSAKELASRLSVGQVVLRCAGRESYGREATGTRSILVSVDQGESVQSVRYQLGFDTVYEPCILLRSGYADFAELAEVGELSRVAVTPPKSVVKRLNSLLGGDGKVHIHQVDEQADPVLFGALKAMGRGKRPGLLACFGLPESPIGGQDAVFQLWERSPTLDGLIFNEQALWRAREVE